MPDTIEVPFTYEMKHHESLIAEIEGTAEIQFNNEEWCVDEIRLDVLGTYNRTTRQSKQIKATGDLETSIRKWIIEDRYTNTSIEDAIKTAKELEVA